MGERNNFDAQPQNMNDEDEFQSGRRGAMPVMVEYEIFNVPSSCLGQLPERVTRAVNTLVGRQRVPSDDDVRELVQGEEQPVPSNAASVYAVSESARRREPARVRVMLPHNVAVELALHRSFQEGGNAEQRCALTAAEVRALVRRSHFFNVRQLRAQQEEAQSPQATRRAPERRRVSPAASTCVICLERVRQSRDRTFLDPCGHVYHKDCIVQWLEKLPRQCPACRVDVNVAPLDESAWRMTTRSQSRARNEPSDGVTRSESLLL